MLEKNKNTIDVSSWSAGVYFIKITTADYVTTEKIGEAVVEINLPAPEPQCHLREMRRF
jgi:hypothetical protein